MKILAAIKREEKRLEKQLGKLQHQLNGIRAAAKALGDSTSRELKAVKKRVLSAAARAKISKATKARWAKFRAAKAKGKHQSLLENGCKRPRKISRKSNREAARYYSYGVTLKSNRVRARGLLLFPATYCQSQSPGWTATFPQNADRLGWRGKDGLNSRLRRMCACRDLG